MRYQMTCAVAALLLSSTGAVYAQGMAPGSASMGDMSPAAYVMAAGQSDQFEIKEGQLAETMGTSTKSTKMVTMAAGESGLPPMPPPPLSPDQQQMMASLKATSGPDFDKLYVQQQMQSHQQALQLQQAYAQTGGDSNLKMTATKIVPVVQEHIDMLQRMQSMMGQ